MSGKLTAAVEVTIEAKGIYCYSCRFVLIGSETHAFCYLFEDERLKVCEEEDDYYRCPECLAAFPSEGAE